MASLVDFPLDLVSEVTCECVGLDAWSSAWRRSVLPSCEEIERRVALSFSERVRVLQEGDFLGYYEVDGVWIVRTPTVAWRKRRVEELKVKMAGVSLGVMSFAVASVVALAFDRKGYLALSLSGMVFGIVAYLREQADLSVCQEFPMLNQRQEAYRGGLFEAYNNYRMEKRDCLLPLERRRLFERYLAQFCDVHIKDIQEKYIDLNKWLNSLSVASNHHPLSREMLKYVYGDDPSPYDEIAKCFECPEVYNVEKLAAWLTETSRLHIERYEQDMRESQRPLDEITSWLHEALNRSIAQAALRRDAALACLDRDDVDARERARVEFCEEEARYKAYTGAVLGLVITVLNPYELKVKNEAKNALRKLQMYSGHWFEQAVPAYFLGLLRFTRNLQRGSASEPINMTTLFGVSLPPPLGSVPSKEEIMCRVYQVVNRECEAWLRGMEV